MNFNKRFNEVIFPKNVKGLVEKYLGDIEHLKNVKTIAYLNSLVIKGKKYNYRHQNTHYNKVFNGNDLLIKAFFRSFCDTVITTDTNIYKHKDNLEGVMIDFDSLGFFASPFRFCSIRKDKKKKYYIVSSNPQTTQIQSNDFFKVDYLRAELLLNEENLSLIPSDKRQIIQKDYNIDFTPIDNLDLKNVIGHSIRNKSEMIFLEGWGNKIVAAFDEVNPQLNPVDLIVNFAIDYDNLDYDYKDFKARKVSKNQNKNKSEQEINEQKELIKQVGDIFVTEKFDENYSLVHRILEKDEKLKGIASVNVYKKKDLVFPVMDANLKKSMKLIKHTRELKNKEKMRNLIRDN